MHGCPRRCPAAPLFSEPRCISQGRSGQQRPLPDPPGHRGEELRRRVIHTEDRTATVFPARSGGNSAGARGAQGPGREGAGTAGRPEHRAASGNATGSAALPARAPTSAPRALGPAPDRPRWGRGGAGRRRRGGRPGQPPDRVPHRDPASSSSDGATLPSCGPRGAASPRSRVSSPAPDSRPGPPRTERLRGAFPHS